MFCCVCSTTKKKVQAVKPCSGTKAQKLDVYKGEYRSTNELTNQRTNNERNIEESEQELHEWTLGCNLFLSCFHTWPIAKETERATVRKGIANLLLSLSYTYTLFFRCCSVRWFEYD